MADAEPSRYRGSSLITQPRVELLPLETLESMSKTTTELSFGTLDYCREYTITHGTTGLPGKYLGNKTRNDSPSYLPRELLVVFWFHLIELGHGMGRSKSLD